MLIDYLDLELRSLIFSTLYVLLELLSDRSRDLLRLWCLLLWRLRGDLLLDRDRPIINSGENLCSKVVINFSQEHPGISIK